MKNQTIVSYPSIEAIKKAMGTETQMDDIIKVPIQLLSTDPENKRFGCRNNQRQSGEIMKNQTIVSYPSIEAIKKAMGTEIQTDDIIKVPVQLLRTDPEQTVIRDYSNIECEKAIARLTLEWMVAPEIIPHIFVAVEGDHLLILDGVIRFIALDRAIASGAIIEQVPVCIVGERDRDSRSIRFI